MALIGYFHFSKGFFFRKEGAKYENCGKRKRRRW